MSSTTPKLVAITGASGGIGREVAKQLAAKGYRVGLIARRKEELEAAVKECGGTGTATYAVADVTVKAEIETAFKQISAAFDNQPIDVLLNNAGRGCWIKPSELTVADIDDMMKVNVHSVLNCVQAILPQMKERKEGHIVNVSSVLGRMCEGMPMRSAYNGAKHFLNGYTESLRGEIKAEFPNIVISTASPGPVATDFGNNANGGPDSRKVPNVQSTESCAAAIVDLIVKRKEECYTDPAYYERVMAVIGGYGKPE